MPYVLTYRAVKGAPLDSAEGDANIHNLDDRLTVVETSPPEARSIVSTTNAGALVTVTYTDDTTDELIFNLPNLRSRGPWAAGETYNVNDTVSHGGALYQALQAFVAGDIFDPDESDSDGALWAEVFPAITTITASNVEYLGSTDTLSSDNVQDALDELAASVQDLESATRSYRGVPGKTVTDDTYTLSVDDMAANYIRFTNPSGCIVTVPADDSDPFELWDEVHIRAATAGDVTIEHESDVTVHEPPGCILTLLGDGATATLKKVGDNEWDAMGLFVEGSL
jgi:hypothetical protein